MRLKAAAAGKELFAGCFTIRLLVDKLDHVTQTWWCHYQSENADAEGNESFKK